MPLRYRAAATAPLALRANANRPSGAPAGAGMVPNLELWRGSNKQTPLPVLRSEKLSRLFEEARWSRSGALGSLARDDEAGLIRGYDGLGAVAQVELGEDAPDVRLRCLGRDDQHRADLGIRQ